MGKRYSTTDIRPFVSIILALATLFAVVFCKMESRRLGYMVWKQSKEYRSLVDKKYLKQITYAKVTQPERVQRLAQTHLTLKEAGRGQIIQITGHKIAMRQ
ncbi:MAG: histidine kinase [Pseudobdellovibrionaceae bacterium]|nr:histidine kinase [Bdellovibrionales bacterium]USN46400.1 MAG: histidine kinase [Pseudobdellovibrionaceae bacterium]